MRHVTSIAILAAGLAGLGVACSDDGPCDIGAGQALSADGGSDGTAGDANAMSSGDASHPSPPLDASGDTASPPAIGNVRLANWSADAPVLDFCLAPHGTTHFEGPFSRLVASYVSQTLMIDAGAEGLPFPGVTAYLPMPAARYDARVVIAGSTNCDAGITPDTTNLAPINGGDSVTIALIGAVAAQTVTASSQPGLRMVEYFDETTTAYPTKVVARFINASPDYSPLDLGVGSAFQFPFASVAFGKSSRPPPPPEPEGGAPDAAVADAAPPEFDFDAYGNSLEADPLGYAIVGGGTGATVTLRQPVTATPVAPLLTASNAGTTPGVALTFVALGSRVDPNGQSGDAAASPAQLLQCVDNAPTAGVYSNCCLFTGNGCVSVPR